MPIISSGFDFEDFNYGGGRKGGQFGGGMQRGGGRDIRYTSKRYGGTGADINNTENGDSATMNNMQQEQSGSNAINKKDPDQGVPEGYSRVGKNYNRFAKEGERKL